jgi:hypothetical protein
VHRALDNAVFARRGHLDAEGWGYSVHGGLEACDVLSVN